MFSIHQVWYSVKFVRLQPGAGTSCPAGLPHMAPHPAGVPSAGGGGQRWHTSSSRVWCPTHSHLCQRAPRLTILQLQHHQPHTGRQAGRPCLRCACSCTHVGCLPAHCWPLHCCAHQNVLLAAPSCSLLRPRLQSCSRRCLVSTIPGDCWSQQACHWLCLPRLLQLLASSDRGCQDNRSSSTVACSTQPGRANRKGPRAGKRGAPLSQLVYR